ncbi:hypothetical protein [[Clostridium] fimetarium]|uniref:Carboxypeptidase regulatory-like domain-containing protein n=1 Tax=[Clostridium] fimetarium TaxID=99656 RepID=A0A1I0Q903_9FIRM|nr:hypothetical protein [[Clostridium] fimetarium]SEW23270.1 hypothetical protein SAMN05421659_10788 [[Clostridium] fimetarium]
MNGSKTSSFIIEGARLQHSKNNHFNIKLDNLKFQIIKGTIYNQKKERCEGAVVQVVQISCRDKSKCLLGYVFTDENGEYIFALEAKSCMIYELAIYAPLIDAKWRNFS